MEVLSKLMELLIVTGMFQGLFLIFTLWRLKSGNPAVNRSLRALLITLYIMLLIRYVLNYINEWWIYQWLFLPDVVIFLFGPLLYIYIRAICCVSPSRLPWYHYIPAVGQFLIFLYIISLSLEDFKSLNYNNKIAAILFMCDEILAILSGLAYIIISFYTIRKSLRDGNAKSQALVFGRFVLTCCLIIMLSWLASFILRIVFPTYAFIWGYNAIWASIPLFFFYVSFYAIKNPKLFEITISKAKKIERITKNAVESIGDSLSVAEQEEQFYLNSQITLHELSKLIKVNSNDLSWYLNNELKKTFYEYINELRVENFKSRIYNKEHHKHTLLSLAYASGFNSKSTFNKSFKLVTGTTPSNFVKEL